MQDIDEGATPEELLNDEYLADWEATEKGQIPGRSFLERVAHAYREEAIRLLAEGGVREALWCGEVALEAEALLKKDGTQA